MTQVGFNMCEKGADMSYTDELDKEMRLRFGAARVKSCHGPVVDNVYYNVAVGTRFGDLEKFAAKNDLRVIIDHGTADIVIEIPHKNRKTIFASDLLECASYRKSKAMLPIAFGVNSLGRAMVWDLRKMPHLLIGGRIGSGKSTFMHSVIASLVGCLLPEQCGLILIDTKGLDFGAWNNSKLLRRPVVTDVCDAMDVMKDIVKEADARYQKIRESKARNIEYYNQNNATPMPYMVVIIDEFADLVKQSKSDFEQYVARITQKMRVVGIHLIMATEHVNAETITGIIKAFMAVRIAFQTQNKAQSKAILGEGGAENLLCYGDALFSDAGRAPVRIHTPYIDVKTIGEI